MKNVYIAALMNIILLNILVTSGTIVLHEAGHYATGLMMGCSEMQIILLDHSLNTFTEMNCPDSPGYAMNSLFMAGFLFVLPMSIILMVSRSHERYYGFVSLGFNMLISSSDIAFLPVLAGYVIMILGFFVLVYGEIYLINNYMLFLENLHVKTSTEKLYF
jgi:hypothetical protein